MANLTKASYQLFSRPDDERFDDFETLYESCSNRKEDSEFHWKSTAELIPMNYLGRLGLKITGDRHSRFNDWSFGQSCQLAEIKKETVNRLKPDTAAQVLMETIPNGAKPFQVLIRFSSRR